MPTPTVPEAAMRRLRPIIEDHIVALTSESDRKAVVDALFRPGGISVLPITDGVKVAVDVVAFLESGPRQLMRIDGARLGYSVVDGEAVCDETDRPERGER